MVVGLMVEWDRLAEWETIAGVEWRLSRGYSQADQQWQLLIETRPADVWWVRNRMAIPSSEAVIA
jgi:hypothetical protein